MTAIGIFANQRHNLTQKMLRLKLPLFFLPNIQLLSNFRRVGTFCQRHRSKEIQFMSSLVAGRILKLAISELHVFFWTEPYSNSVRKKCFSLKFALLLSLLWRKFLNLVCSIKNELKPLIQNQAKKQKKWKTYFNQRLHSPAETQLGVQTTI